MPLAANDISKVFTATDILCKAGQYGLLNKILSSANIENMTQDMMVAYLDATFYEKVKLTERSSFFKKCNEVLEKRGEKKSVRFQRMG